LTLPAGCRPKPNTIKLPSAGPPRACSAGPRSVD
jgi:hypothetical protein